MTVVAVGRPGHLVMVGRQAAVFDRFSGWALGWLYRDVATRVSAALPQQPDVLDVGTGPGRLLLEIARRRPDAHVVGIDPSTDMIDRAARHAHDAGLGQRVEPVVAGAEDLPFPDESFDAIVSTLSSHHWADTAAAIAEQARVLRPGGRLWVVDLRGRPSAALPGTLADHFPAAAISQPPLGRVASLALVCYQAIKASGR